ncbi:hypothetical protein A9Y76_27485 (plasmid) [Ralstonia insidiosa]|uniref:Uncharacterized protein n=1 Tax=Ralstonia insidiosa TaxID=190721 RepID=A0A192A7N1_9RALS|nr:hypothetical protein A9Y76_27485 [Ralstonia insidiosa]KMW44790.1 hypothetical protein AC240_22775 [Ralstonia sp. MD27]
MHYARPHDLRSSRQGHKRRPFNESLGNRLNFGFFHRLGLHRDGSRRSSLSRWRHRGIRLLRSCRR